MHTEGPGIWRENGKSRKREIHTLGREIWRGKLKKVENLEMYTVAVFRHSKRGRQISLRMVVSHHVVAGI